MPKKKTEPPVNQNSQLTSEQLQKLKHSQRFQTASTLLFVDDSSEIKDLFSQTEGLVDTIKDVRKGDLSDLEEMLVSQNQVLNAVFHKLTRQAMKAKYVPQLQTYMELALKCQASSRKTILAIAEMKNPRRATFIKNQLNQVAVLDSEIPKNSENTTNKLFTESSTHAPLDIRSTTGTSAQDSNLETLEVLDRPQK